MAEMKKKRWIKYTKTVHVFSALKNSETPQEISSRSVSISEELQWNDSETYRDAFARIRRIANQELIKLD